MLADCLRSHGESRSVKKEEKVANGQFLGMNSGLSYSCLLTMYPGKGRLILYSTGKTKCDQAWKTTSTEYMLSRGCFSFFGRSSGILEFQEWHSLDSALYMILIDLGKTIITKGKGTTFSLKDALSMPTGYNYFSRSQVEPSLSSSSWVWGLFLSLLQWFSMKMCALEVSTNIFP